MNLFVFALIPLILSIGIIPSMQSEIFLNADAIKAKGNSLTEINSNKVCGDKLCSDVSEIPGILSSMITMPEKDLFSSTLDYTETGPEIDPEKGYAVIEIGDGLYWITDGEYQLMFLTTGEGVILVDAPLAMGEKTLQAISEVTSEKVTHFIYSHIHKDHVGSASLLPKDTIRIAHSDTAKHLKIENESHRSDQTITFDDMYTLNVGDQTLELLYIGPFHSKGDIVVYSPSHEVIMAVDFFHPNAAPFKHFGITKNLDAHIVAHNKLLAMGWEVLVSGHGPILGTPEHLEFNKEFTLSILNNAFISMWTVQPSANYFDDVVENCVELTLAQYPDLKDIEVYPVENCFTMAHYAMFD